MDGGEDATNQRRGLLKRATGFQQMAIRAQSHGCSLMVLEKVVSGVAFGFCGGRGGIGGRHQWMGGTTRGDIRMDGADIRIDDRRRD
jgi:hypothetical protein